MTGTDTKNAYYVFQANYTGKLRFRIMNKGNPGHYWHRYRCEVTATK